MRKRRVQRRDLLIESRVRFQAEGLFRITPGASGGGGYSRDEAGSVTKGQELAYETPQLPAGKYTVTLSHDPASPGGDADLYVKAGSAPTLTSYDCRPYVGGSSETCQVRLDAPARVHVMVRGYGTQSTFTLVGN